MNNCLTIGNPTADLVLTPDQQHVFTEIKRYVGIIKALKQQTAAQRVESIKELHYISISDIDGAMQWTLADREAVVLCSLESHASPDDIFRTSGILLATLAQFDPSDEVFGILIDAVLDSVYQKQAEALGYEDYQQQIDKCKELVSIIAKVSVAIKQGKEGILAYLDRDGATFNITNLFDAQDTSVEELIQRFLLYSAERVEEIIQDLTKVLAPEA